MIRLSHFVPPQGPTASSTLASRAYDLLQTSYSNARMVAEQILALAGLAATAPVILAAAIAVKWDNRGPAFYTQPRLGLRGRSFTIFKLRTMTHQCELQSGPQWSQPHDPRVTRVGRFLRDTHIDELPQLLNVLRGEMSLIGPRPERPGIASEIGRWLPRFRERLRVRPGVTGLAQVQLPPDSDLDSVRRKLICDLFYIAHRGPWLDLRILVGTALHLVGVPYALIADLCQLRPKARPSAVESTPTAA